MTAPGVGRVRKSAWQARTSGAPLRSPVAMSTHPMAAVTTQGREPPDLPEEGEEGQPRQAARRPAAVLGEAGPAAAARWRAAPLAQDGGGAAAGEEDGRLPRSCGQGRRLLATLMARQWRHRAWRAARGRHATLPNSPSGPQRANNALRAGGTRSAARARASAPSAKLWCARDALTPPGIAREEDWRWRAPGSATSARCRRRGA